MGQDTQKAGRSACLTLQAEDVALERYGHLPAELDAVGLVARLAEIRSGDIERLGDLGIPGPNVKVAVVGREWHSSRIDQSGSLLTYRTLL